MKAFVVVGAALLAGSSFSSGAAVGMLDSLDGPNITARRVSPVSLSDLRQFSEESPWINPAIPEFYAALPSATLGAPSRRISVALHDYSKDGPEQAPLSLRPSYYATGEVGAFYGTSLGRTGGSAYGGYIMGTVGNDRTQISASASYETGNFHIPNRR